MVWLWNLKDVLDTLNYNSDAKRKAHKKIFGRKFYESNSIFMHFLIARFESDRTAAELKNYFKLRFLEKFFISIASIIPVKFLQVIRSLRGRK